LAQNLLKLQVDRHYFIEELLQDEEREVVKITGHIIGDLIIEGDQSWLPKYVDLIKHEILLNVPVIKQLPKVL